MSNKKIKLDPFDFKRIPKEIWYLFCDYLDVNSKHYLTCILKLDGINLDFEFIYQQDMICFKYFIVPICIEFSYSFNDSLQNSLPQSLKILKFDVGFNQPIHSLPNSLEELEFGRDFNQELPYLPQSLKILRFSVGFNQLLYSLPNSLEELVFGRNFNQELPSLPQSLKILEFGFRFNQNLPLLPYSLEGLVFGICFNQKLDFLLELQNLKKVVFGRNLNDEQNNIIQKLIQKNIKILIF
jgi:hypothetical protein